MKKILLFTLLLSVSLSLFAEGLNEALLKKLPKITRKSRFAGQFDRYHFAFDGSSAIIVFPQKPDPAGRWIWRARFFGHQPQTDIALLNRGYYLVFVGVGNLFGNPRAVLRWDRFYEFLTKKCGLSPYPVLEGMSRGGLIVFNWAKKNPDKCAAVYVDAPVCDIRSWPCHNLKTKDAQQCMKVYGLTYKDLPSFKGNPIDGLEKMAKAKLPVLAVNGIIDTVVPMKKNIHIFAARYKALGGEIRCINKPGNHHHPHSLGDPSPIVNFLLLHSAGSNDYAVARGSLEKMTEKIKTVRQPVAIYAGGEIAPLPALARFRFTAAKSSDGRKKGDLYIVNCDTKSVPDGASLEKLLGNIRKSSPTAGILLIYPGTKALVNEYMGGAPLIHKKMITKKNRSFRNHRKPFKANARIASLEKVAAKYKCDSIDISRDLAERILHREFAEKDLEKASMQIANENTAAMLLFCQRETALSRGKK